MRSNPNCNDNRRDKVALRSIEDCLHHKCKIQDYQNKNWLSVCGILSLQLKRKQGHTKPSPGPLIGHRCYWNCRMLDYNLGKWKISWVFSENCVMCPGPELL